LQVLHVIELPRSLLHEPHKETSFTRSFSPSCPSCLYVYEVCLLSNRLKILTSGQLFCLDPQAKAKCLTKLFSISLHAVIGNHSILIYRAREPTSKDSKCSFRCDCDFGRDMKKSLQHGNCIPYSSKNVVSQTQNLYNRAFTLWISHILNP